MKSAYVVKKRTVVDQRRTCTWSGCSNEPGYPLAKSVNVYEQNLSVVTQTNNKRSRSVWSPFAYTITRSFPGGRESRGYERYAYPGVNPPQYILQLRTYTFSGNSFTTQTGFSKRFNTLSEASYIAQARLLSKLQDAQHLWGAAVSLGESRETATFILDKGKQLATAAMQLKKGQVSKFLRTLKGSKRLTRSERQAIRRTKMAAAQSSANEWANDWSRYWLESHFAWAPLLSDVDSAARYLAERFIDRKIGLTRQSATGRSQGVQKTVTAPSSFSGGYLQTQVETTHVRYTYELSLKPGKEPTTMSELGFTDPLSVIWELIPLSFVADYFVNVGQVLSSLHEFNKWQVKRGQRSYRDVIAVDLELTSQPTNFLYDLTHPTQSYRQRRFDRSPLGNLPTSLPLKVKVENPFDLQSDQWLTLGALFKVFTQK